MSPAVYFLSSRVFNWFLIACSWAYETLMARNGLVPTGQLCLVDLTIVVRSIVDIPLIPFVLFLLGSIMTASGAAL